MFHGSRLNLEYDHQPQYRSTIRCDLSYLGNSRHLLISRFGGSIQGIWGSHSNTYGAHYTYIQNSIEMRVFNSLVKSDTAAMGTQRPKRFRYHSESLNPEQRGKLSGVDSCCFSLSLIPVRAAFFVISDRELTVF